MVGISCNDQVNGLLNFQLTPSVINIGEDDNGHPLMNQRWLYKISNPSEMSDTQFFLQPSFILSKAYLASLEAFAGSATIVAALTYKFASGSTTTLAENLVLDLTDEIADYKCYTGKFSKYIGDGGYVPIKVFFEIDFFDQNEAISVYSMEFQALT